MTVYVSIAIDLVEEDADIDALAIKAMQAVQEKLKYLNVSLNEVEAV